MRSHTTTQNAAAKGTCCAWETLEPSSGDTIMARAQPTGSRVGSSAMHQELSCRSLTDMDRRGQMQPVLSRTTGSGWLLAGVMEEQELQVTVNAVGDVVPS